MGLASLQNSRTSTSNQVSQNNSMDRNNCYIKKYLSIMHLKNSLDTGLLVSSRDLKFSNIATKFSNIAPSSHKKSHVSLFNFFI